MSVDSEKALAANGIAHAGGHAKSIDCESGVEAKVGNTATCTAKLTNGQTVTLVLKVDKVSGNSGHLTIVSAKTSR